ncbi:hypothetical protein [Mycobacterium nebraskense]|uniref:Uncharacterized protein n=1 Tax=Mycobacterium nebraskense TaxID=244292 RepID=A0A1X1Z1D1_9MYCO|nr:hypothetical protein [Mycobacterium nebraskense]KKC05851.1 hypothetical protein WU83_06170 [Mycobacterium nebraskense]MBI2692779.1 hypothetical protein [Mycobacterium nebraskense]MCV7115890.1 hypothetical protein [Mycobacterium nebraskense]ORW17106.1 hypothetical protein AWC17_13585 [Mycobacterium nebraskense]
MKVIDHARFTAEVGLQSGRAVEGLDAVCSALRQGAVAPNENVLSEQGAAAAKTLHQPVG